MTLEERDIAARQREQARDRKLRARLLTLIGPEGENEDILRDLVLGRHEGGRWDVPRLQRLERALDDLEYEGAIVTDVGGMLYLGDGDVVEELLEASR